MARDGALGLELHFTWAGLAFWKENPCPTFWVFARAKRQLGGRMEMTAVLEAIRRQWDPC